MFPEYLTRQVLGRPVCDRGAIPQTLVQSNMVRSRLIILINEEINEANGPDKIVAGEKKKKKKISTENFFFFFKLWRKKKIIITKRIGW